MTEVKTIRLGTCNTYLIKENQDCLLIDAGNRGKEDVFTRILNKIGVTTVRLLIE